MSTIATLSSFDDALNGDGGDVDRYIQSLHDVARFSERMIEHTFFYKREH